MFVSQKFFPLFTRFVCGRWQQLLSSGPSQYLLCLRVCGIKGRGKESRRFCKSWFLQKDTTNFIQKETTSIIRPNSTSIYMGSIMDHILFIYKVVKELVAIFPVLRDWIAEFLLDNKFMIASEVGHNMLIEQVKFTSKLCRVLTIKILNIFCCCKDETTKEGHEGKLLIRVA